MPTRGATIFLLRIEGASARFFSWFSAMASLAPTNAHLNCGLHGLVAALLVFGLSAVNNEQIIAARMTTVIYKAVFIANAKIHGILFDQLV